MRMKKLVSRTKAKKQDRAKHSRRTRTAIAALGVALAVTGAVAAARFAAPSAPPAAADQRFVENKKAQAELAAPAADYAAATSSAPAPVAKVSPVTMTGCLEQRGDEFRLKDAEGGGVTKARSWKSGFLRKGTPTIDVIDGGNRLKLKDHVGRRVSVTGVLVDREMQARSVKNVAAPCGN